MTALSVDTAVMKHLRETPKKIVHSDRSKYETPDKNERKTQVEMNYVKRLNFLAKGRQVMHDACKIAKML